MAAEHEGAERTAEEIAQLLYHVQVLMLACGPDARRRLPTGCDPLQAADLLRDRRTQQGLAVRAGARRCCARPATGSASDAARAGRCSDPDNDIEFFFLRPRDIAMYVGSGQLDVGITGRDLLLDSGAPADEILPLGFGGVDVPLRRPGPGTATDVHDLAGLRVATVVPGAGRRHLAEHGVAGRGDPARRRRRDRGPARRRRRRSPTSSRPGRTLRQAGLEIFGEPILQSEAVLVRRRGARRRPGGRPARPPAAGRHRRADVRDDGLRHPGRRCVEARVRAHPGHRVADGLAAARRGLGRRPRDGARARTPTRSWTSSTDLGARGILVTDIHACRL